MQTLSARLPFLLLLLWLFVLPWPLGANRDWIWPWLSAALLLIAALAIWQQGGRLRWHDMHPGLRIALIGAASVALIDLLRVLVFAVSGDGATAPWSLADPDAGKLGALKSASLAVLLGLLVMLVKSRRRARWLLSTLFVGGVLQALTALIITLGGYSFNWFGHPFVEPAHVSGTFVNRNHFAGMLELSAAAGFGLLASGLHASDAAENWREWLRRVVQALLGSRFAVRAGLAVLVVALVLTRSRMGNAAFFLGLTTAGIAALIWWRPLPRILIWLLVSIIAVDLLVLGAWVGVDKVAERMAETRLVSTAVPPSSTDAAGDAPAAAASTLEPSDAERVAVAGAAIALWQQRPWLGHGAGSFRLVLPHVKPASVSLFYEHAHNDYLQTLVERGIAGFVLWCGGLLGLLWAALTALRGAVDSLVRGLALATIYAAAALGAHSLVDFNLQIPANFFWFATCMMLGVLALRLPQRRMLSDRPDEAIDVDAV